MKIQAKCRTCGRDFLLSQIGPDSDTPGRCPFCGAHFARHYSSLLVDSVKETEESATHFLRAVSQLQALDTGFDIDVDGFIDYLVEQIRGSRGAPTSAT